MHDDEIEIEREACLRLGRFLFAFAYLETNLGMCVVDAERRPGLVSSNVEPTGQRTFALLLDALLQIIDTTFDHSTIAYASWTSWYMRADAVRELRNRFVHSKWVALWHQQIIVNVTGIPGQANRNERILSLPELDRDIKETNVLVNNLSRMRTRYPLE